MNHKKVPQYPGLSRWLGQRHNHRRWRREAVGSGRPVYGLVDVVINSAWIDSSTRISRHLLDACYDHDDGMRTKSLYTPRGCSKQSKDLRIEVVWQYTTTAWLCCAWLLILMPQLYRRKVGWPFWMRYFPETGSFHVVIPPELGYRGSSDGLTKIHAGLHVEFISIGFAYT